MPPLFNFGMMLPQTPPPGLVNPNSPAVLAGMGGVSPVSTPGVGSASAGHTAPVPGGRLPQAAPGSPGLGSTLFEMLQDPMIQQMLMGQGGTQGAQGGPQQAPGIHMPNLSGFQPFMPAPIAPVTFGGMFG